MLAKPQLRSWWESNSASLHQTQGASDLSPEALAATIQAELSNDYIYRLQTNRQDYTVQFNIVLELRREDGTPVKIAVGLKYFPETATLSFVTMK